MEHKFNIALNKEEKEAGNIRKVVLNISFEGVSEDTIRKHAMANMTVAWQNQIRNDWEGELPEEVIFGEPLFASRRAAPMTAEGAKKMLLDNLSPEKMAEVIAEMQAKLAASNGEA